MQAIAAKLPPHWQAIEQLPPALYTAAQVRELDAQAIAVGTPGIVLMSRAARAILSALQHHWPMARRIAVFCGSGNNAGDGYLVARLATERGFDVRVIELCDAARLKGDAATARQSLVDSGIAPVPMSDQPPLDDYDLIVDALLGTGLSGSVRPNFAEAIAGINAAAAPVIAVDVPSGIISDTGAVAGSGAVIADLTVSFIGVKRGLFTGDAVNHVGKLSFADLGVQVDARSVSENSARVELSQLSQLIKKIPVRSRNAYKNQSGHLLIIGGDYGMAGAVLLTAMAALRCGAGLVSVATRPEHVGVVVSRQPDIMAVGIDKTRALQALLKRSSAVVIGPGLGTGPWSQQLLQQVRSLSIPVLLDADALNLVAQTPSFLPQGRSVLTPHSGEAARLLTGLANSALVASADQDWTNKTVNANRFASAAQLQQSTGATVLLKGAGTIVDAGAVTDQYNLQKLCPYGSGAMATAGMGDVLSGVIGALMVQGLVPGDAAELGAVLHAAAADYTVQHRGPHGLAASDMPQALRALLNKLLSEPIEPQAKPGRWC